MDYSTLRANISLLYLLRKEPGKARGKSPKQSHKQPNPVRVLDFGRECDLVDTLAFISGHTDDPEGVVAVCVEEESPSSLIIRIAVNAGDPKQVETRFKPIAARLEAIANMGLCKQTFDNQSFDILANAVG